MRTFQCLLLVLKRSYIRYYEICMTLPLTVLNGCRDVLMMSFGTNNSTVTTLNMYVCICIYGMYVYMMYMIYMYVLDILAHDLELIKMDICLRRVDKA